MLSLLANFSTSSEADKEKRAHRSYFGLSAQYRVARLAIGCSLGEPSVPLQHSNNLGKTIKGEQDAQGHRALRMVLSIDEARHILASKHKALSDIIRLHRSKGLVAMLASQSPDDYEGAADDYLENIGLPICFKTNANSTIILQNMFKSRVSFASLPSGVFLTLKDAKAIKVKAF